MRQRSTTAINAVASSGTKPRAISASKSGAAHTSSANSDQQRVAALHRLDEPQRHGNRQQQRVVKARMRRRDQRRGEQDRELLVPRHCRSSGAQINDNCRDRRDRHLHGFGQPPRNTVPGKKRKPARAEQPRIGDPFIGVPREFEPAQPRLDAEQRRAGRRKSRCRDDRSGERLPLARRDERDRHEHPELRLNRQQTEQGTTEERRPRDGAPAADQQGRDQKPILPLHDIVGRAKAQKCRCDDQPSRVPPVGGGEQCCDQGNAAQELKQDVGCDERQRPERHEQQQKARRIDPGAERDRLRQPPPEIGIEISGECRRIEDQPEPALEIGVRGTVKRHPVGAGAEHVDVPGQHQQGQCPAQ